MRKLSQSMSSMDWAAAHINDIDEVYKEPHPEISKQLIDTMVMIRMLKEHVDQLRTIF